MQHLEVAPRRAAFSSQQGFSIFPVELWTLKGKTDNSLLFTATYCKPLSNCSWVQLTVESKMAWSGAQGAAAQQLGIIAAAEMLKFLMTALTGPCVGSV